MVWHAQHLPLQTHLDKVACRDNLYFASLFGFVGIYNRLPGRLVETNSVKEFQRSLTVAARRRCTQWGSELVIGVQQLLRVVENFAFHGLVGLGIVTVDFTMVLRFDS